MKDLFSQGGSGSAGIKTNKQAVARRFDVKQSEVTYLNTIADLSQFAVLYDKANQRAYALPVLPTGTVAISLVNGLLTHSNGSVDLGLLGALREEWNFLKQTFTTGFTVNAYNDVVLFNGVPYRWMGALPKTLPANSSPIVDGIGSAKWTKVYMASAIGILNGGTVQDTILTVNVNAFGADPTGLTSSTDAVLDAIRSVFGTIPDSTFNASTYKPVVIEFGSGTYVLGDIPFISGVMYKGQSNFSTRVDPEAGASWVFTTVGTQDYATGGISKRFVGGGLRDISIGSGNVTQVHTPTTDVSAVRIQYASWIQLENVLIKNVDGNGLYVDELWDVDVNLCQVQAAGLGYTPTNNYVGLHIGPGTSPADGTNAVRFIGFHIEGCPKLYDILERTRHVSFTDAKFEALASGVSNIIQGVSELSFNNAELTWARSDLPMVYAITGDSDGISFNDCRLISASNTPGWYFRYNSANGPLRLNGLHARNASKIIDGSNFVMVGATSWFSGPNIINAFQKAKVSDCVFKAGRAPTTTDGLTDALIMTGTLCEFVDNVIEVGGTNSNGAACINIPSGATDAVVLRNTFLGATQYGIRQNSSVVSKFIRDNRIGAGGNIASLITGSNALYSVVSINAAGLGNGGVNGAGSVAVANGASTTLALAAGATKMLVRGTYNSLTAAAELFVDAGTAAIVVGAQTTSGGGTVIQTGTGASGDGSIRVSKSGGNITFTNYTGSALTLNISTLSAVA